MSQGTREMRGSWTAKAIVPRRDLVRTTSCPHAAHDPWTASDRTPACGSRPSCTPGQTGQWTWIRSTRRPGSLVGPARPASSTVAIDRYGVGSGGQVAPGTAL
jgi:hypothetical protein